jgi:hypothetical protein
MNGIGYESQTGICYAKMIKKGLQSTPRDEKVIGIKTRNKEDIWVSGYLKK